MPVGVFRYPLVQDQTGKAPEYLYSDMKLDFRPRTNRLSVKLDGEGLVLYSVFTQVDRCQSAAVREQQEQ